jgi:hypothetical protein
MTSAATSAATEIERLKREVGKRQCPICVIDDGAAPLLVDVAFELCDGEFMVGNDVIHQVTNG